VKHTTIPYTASRIVPNVPRVLTAYIAAGWHRVNPASKAQMVEVRKTFDWTTGEKASETPTKLG
jgi:hypothetical protein